MKRIITGVKPTGAMPHVGNLLGAILPFHALSQGTDAAIFIADYHGLTSVRDAQKMTAQVSTVAITYLAAFGLDTEVTIFRQSDIRQLPKLHWILSNFTPYSLMLRAHSFKDSQAKNADINMGVFTYPILMAADILGYDVDEVPVGQDQRQHLEMARDIARSVNSELGGALLKEPTAYIKPSVATLPGVDGRKMSKSYDNFIGVFDDEKTLKKRVMSIVTDSKGVDEPKDPDTCHVFALIHAFASPDQVSSIRECYLKGGYGYGHAKLALLEILVEYLRSYRETRILLERDPYIIVDRLQKGALRMNERMDEVVGRLSSALGV